MAVKRNHTERMISPYIHRSPSVVCRPRSTYYVDTSRLTIYCYTTNLPTPLLRITHGSRTITHVQPTTYHALATSHVSRTTFRPRTTAPSNSKLLPRGGINFAHTSNVTEGSHSACTLEMLLCDVNCMSVFQHIAF